MGGNNFSLTYLLSFTQKRHGISKIILKLNIKIKKCSSGSLSNTSKFYKERTDQPSSSTVDKKGPQEASSSLYVLVKAKCNSDKKRNSVFWP